MGFPAGIRESIFTKSGKHLTINMVHQIKQYMSRKAVPNTTIPVLAKACDSWQLSAGDGGDTVTMLRPNRPGPSGTGAQDQGFVQAEYINRSLEQG